MTISDSLRLNLFDNLCTIFLCAKKCKFANLEIFPKIYGSKTSACLTLTISMLLYLIPSFPCTRQEKSVYLPSPHMQANFGFGRHAKTVEGLQAGEWGEYNFSNFAGKAGKKSSFRFLLPSTKINQNCPPRPSLPFRCTLSSRHRSCVRLLRSFFYATASTFPSISPSSSKIAQGIWPIAHTLEPCLAAGSCVGVKGYRRRGGRGGDFCP